MSNKLNLEAFGVAEMSQTERVHVIGGEAPRWVHRIVDKIWDTFFN